MILGFDIGGTKCAAILANNDAEIVSREVVATDPALEPKVIIEALIQAARKLLADRDVKDAEVAGIGISCGGPLDSANGTICSPPNLPLWVEVPVRDWVQAAFPDVAITLENDANATALAEWKYGAGRGTQNMIFLTMGTGIGGGLILDGRLYRGTNDLAGEVGHQTILLNGPKCGCGKRGCLEALASGPSIARLARESLHYGRGKKLIEIAGGKPANITAQNVVKAAKLGDPVAINVLAEAGTYMGIGLANLIQILNPQKIVLGTIAVHAGDLVMEPIRKAVAEYSWSRSNTVCKIVPAELGDRAQDMAAISLVDLSH